MQHHRAAGAAELEIKDASVHGCQEEADKNSFHPLVLSFFSCAVLIVGDPDSTALSSKGWLFF